MRIEQIVASVVLLLIIVADILTIVFGMASTNETLNIIGLLLLIVSILLVFILIFCWAIDTIFF